MNQQLNQELVTTNHQLLTPRIEVNVNALREQDAQQATRSRHYQKPVEVRRKDWLLASQPRCYARYT